jgi:hypothetical protein
MKSRIFLWLIAFVFCSCSNKESWWVGTWRLDVEQTKSMMKVHNQPSINRLSIEMGCALNGNSDYVITTNQIGIMIGGRLAGVPYSVLRRDSESSVVLLVSQRTNTLCWENGYLVQKLPGENSRDVEYYYRRK